MSKPFKRLTITSVVILCLLSSIGFAFAKTNTTATASPKSTDKPVIKVTFLGTGAPEPQVTRFGPSTLIEVGGEKLLFDAGRGVAQRIRQVNNGTIKGVDKVFFTHLHSDHVVGFPDFWLTGIIPGMGDRTVPLQIFGPKGTQSMMENLTAAYDADLKSRYQSGIAPEGSKWTVKEYEDGVVYDHNGIKVTAFTNSHIAIKPSFGFRIDYKGHSVVLSGDTTYDERVAENAKGVDLLVHEVFATTPEMIAKEPPLAMIQKTHTTIEQAATIFNKAKPKQVIYNHLVLLGIQDEEKYIMDKTKRLYKGNAAVSRDLMTVEIGNKIKITKPKKNQMLVDPPTSVEQMTIAD